MEELFLIEYYIDNINLKCTMMKGVEEEDIKLNVDLEFAKFASICIRQDEFEFDILETDTDDETDGCVIPEFEDPNAPPRECDSSDEVQIEDDSKDNEIFVKRNFKCGASLLFANTMTNVIQLFKKFPLEIFVYTTNEYEKKTCLGNSKIHWNSEIWDFLEDKKCSCSNVFRMTWLTTVPLTCEDSGCIIGDISLGVRVTLLGRSIHTKFHNCLCRVEPAKGKRSFSCNLYGVSIKKRGENLHRTYQKCGYVEYLVKLIKQILKSEGLQAPVEREGPREPKKGARTPKDEGCMCKAGCGKGAGVCVFKTISQQFTEGIKVEMKNDGVSGCCGGTTAPKEESVENSHPHKKGCTGPCNRDKPSCTEDVTSAQNLVYEGLTAMLNTVKEEMHRKFCPAFVKKGTCPTGACYLEAPKK